MASEGGEEKRYDRKGWVIRMNKPDKSQHEHELNAKASEVAQLDERIEAIKQQIDTAYEQRSSLRAHEYVPASKLESARAKEAALVSERDAIKAQHKQVRSPPSSLSSFAFSLVQRSYGIFARSLFKYI